MTHPPPNPPTPTLARLTHRAWFGPALLAGLFIIVLGGLLMLMQRRALDSQRSDLVDNARAAQDAIGRRLRANEHYLDLLAQDMARDALTEPLFERRVNSYLLDHPELVSIAFIDTESTIQWAAPRLNDEGDSLIGLRVTDPAPLRAARLAADARKPVYTEPFVTIRGDTAFEITVPIYRQDSLVGTLTGTCSCERLLRHALTRETFAKHRVSLVNETGDAVVSLPTVDRVDDRLAHTVALTPPGHGVALRLVRYGAGFWGWSVTLLVVLCVGLVLGMAWGMWSLNRHIARRAEAERALVAARDELETRVRERTADLEAEMAERQDAEERLRQHQEQLTHVARVSTMGEMAAGLAHELHQPLGAITSFAEGGLMMIEQGEQDTRALIEPLKEVSDQAQRAGRILHRLRDFVRDQAMTRTVAPLNELADEVAQLMDIEVRENQVDLRFDFASSNGHDTVPPVLVDRIQIQQVLLNLMRNAIEAMRDTPPEDRRLNVDAHCNGEQMLEVTVADSGPGCPPQHARQIFDAFYTTKKSGMGMGLSISRTIVESHGGRLWVNTATESTTPDIADGSSASSNAGFKVHFTIPLADTRDEHD